MYSVNAKYNSRNPIFCRLFGGIRHYKKLTLKQMNAVFTRMGEFIFGALVVTLLSLLFSILIKVLFNHVAAPIFNLPAIDIWKAAGLFILCRILVGSK